MEKLYPLRFKEILLNYGFGDRWIADEYQKTALPEDHRIAETWEVVDRKNESSILINGDLGGKTFNQLIKRNGVQLLGSDVVARCGTRFPLLIKFLDASNVLSEQAHHNDALAAKQGLDDPGKTEAWYMLKVRDGATIHCGHQPGVSEDKVRKALLQGNTRSLMQEYRVKPGDGFLLHAGTMHYSKGGVLFYEIMQNSDVYISLRKIDPDMSAAEKEEKLHFILEGVHLEEGFDPKIQPVRIQYGNNYSTFAFVCEYFALERLDLVDNHIINCDGQRFYVLSQIEGSCVIQWQGTEEMLLPGQTCLLPACLGNVTIHPEQDCAVLKTYVPDLEKNVIKPCRDAGVTDTQIAGLGGFTRLNPLLGLLPKHAKV